MWKSAAGEIFGCFLVIFRRKSFKNRTFSAKKSPPAVQYYALDLQEFRFSFGSESIKESVLELWFNLLDHQEFLVLSVLAWLRSIGCQEICNRNTVSLGHQEFLVLRVLGWVDFVRLSSNFCQNLCFVRSPEYSLDHQKLSGNLQNSDKVSVRSSGF